MATQNPYKLYKNTGQQGQSEYSLLPSYNVDPSSGAEVTDPSEAYSYLSQLKGMGAYTPGSRTGVQFDAPTMATQLEETLKQYESKKGQYTLSGVQNPLNPKETLNNIEPSRLESIQQEAQQVQSGQLTNVGTSQQPRYTPTGSAGALQAQGKSFAEQLKTPTAQLPGVFPVDPNAIPKKYEEAFNNAKATGITSPSDYTGANDMYKTFLSDQGQSSQIDNFISQDPYLNSVMSNYQQYMNQQNQRTSLVEEYQNLLKSSGIEGIDTELINMKNVIEGSEEDIRTEITKAGGFATESQVVALTNARNKQLIKNYNTLLETRASKEKYLDTLINLTVQDRQEADQRFDTMMNFGFKITEINQTMKKSAVETIDRLVTAMGWDGVWNATGGDSQLVAQIEKTYGLPQGGLYQAAYQADIDRYNKETKEAQEMALTEAQIEGKQFDRDFAQQKFEEDKRQFGLQYALDQEKLSQDKSGVGNEQPTSYQEWSLAGGLEGTGKTYGEFISSQKPLTVDQAKANQFATAANNANQVLNSSKYKVGLVELPLPNIFKSSNRQQFEQASRAFINAVLRRESGATITDDEFKNKYRELIPSAGDSNAVISQKKSARNAAVSSIRAAGTSTDGNLTDDEAYNLYLETIK